MRGRLWRWGTRIGSPVVVAALALWSGLAAAVSVPIPSGWVEPGRAPVAGKVRAWADRATGRIQSMATTQDPDGYAEVVAVIEVPRPIPNAALAPSPASDAARSQTLRAAAKRLFGFDAPPKTTGVVDLGVGAPLLRARWTIGTEAFYLALAPTDQSHVAIIMVVEAETAVLYEAVFEGLLVDIDGLQAPREPFARARWFWLGVLGWAVGAAVVVFAVARSALHLQAAAVGTRAAIVLSMASLVVAIGVYTAAADDRAALALAGISGARLALEVAGPGALMAGLIAVGGLVVARRRTIVPSAPSGGAFAPQPSPTAAPSPVYPMGREPAPPRMEITAKRPTGELPANLEIAAELEVDEMPRGVPVADAPGLLRPEPVEASAGVPTAIDPSGPASLDTEQILIERRPASERAYTKRTFEDTGGDAT